MINSDIGFFGTASSDTYGLTWQVVSGRDAVVRGVVSGSHIHDCQMGVSTRDGNDVVWSNNVVEGNTLYGYNPYDPAQKSVIGKNSVSNDNSGLVIRWASTTQRIYVSGRGSATLANIKNTVPTAPLTLVDPTNKIWLLSADLYVTDGAHLQIYGPGIGGDVKELRLNCD